jgi:hypothetical protein
MITHGFGTPAIIAAMSALQARLLVFGKKKLLSESVS